MPAPFKSFSGTIKRCQRIEKRLRPGRQSLLQVLARLDSHILAELLFICGTNSGEVVHADVKTGTCSQREQPLYGLRFHLHLLEGLLLLKCTAIRTVPVTIVVKCAPVLTSNTPVTYFMQSTGIIAVSKDYLCETLGSAGRQVFRFMTALDQNRPVGIPEKVIKQHDKIIRTVIHWVAIVRLYRPQYQREL